MTGHRKRPRDPLQLAKLIGDIATGQVEDKGPEFDPGKDYARKGGLKGGKARAEVLSPQRRQEIARKAAKTRWAASSARGKKEHQEP